MIWADNDIIENCHMFSDQQQYYKVLCRHIIVKSEYLWNILVINFTSILWWINWEEKNWENNMIWVGNATIQLCLMFSDQQKYYKVLCGHIMVKSKYFWYFFVINLTCIWWWINWARKILKNNVMSVHKATIHLHLMTSNQKWDYKVLCGHMMVKYGYFGNILRD